MVFFFPPPLLVEHKLVHIGLRFCFPTGLNLVKWFKNSAPQFLYVSSYSNICLLELPEE